MLVNGRFPCFGFLQYCYKAERVLFLYRISAKLCPIYAALTMRNDLLGVIIIVLLVWVSFLLQESVKNAANSGINNFFIIINFEKCVQE